ncbi:NAD(P)H-quinone dehydrogenase [Pseudonocardia asaccharolytica]|uniref:Dihydrolipoamide dehydrogenase n=1 Tax=Pseudonocardia asaccharolytica DSM 44247 = NBRC 16224 TaxID=1123024 RepID=A0A511D9S0_9PSEU|nr:NAD(P)H-quinone dehydrogenase [Pseudonocardia asaccharolytica]GEL19698.1 dihydrolipoamide dehydrogenase [Pseudonocardia asaccharolytica DSM 44247 = NBRC 16224]
MTRIVIMGGGPAGYEAALVAAQHGSDVTVVEPDGMGGACVLDDCVPSKTFISTAGVRVDLHRAEDLGVLLDRNTAAIDLPKVHGRVKGLALAQSADVRARVEREGVRIVAGTAAFSGQPSSDAPHVVEARHASGEREDLLADVVLVATGATPRILDAARPDGERILTWRQLYDLPELPEHLIVIGSGVTGAEFVSAYVELGCQVTLVSSRDRVLPGEDADAAAVLQDVFTERGVNLLSKARAASVVRDGDGVLVTLVDGRTVRGSHALMTVGSVPNTTDLGCEKIGIATDSGGFITVDRVSRTSVPGVYAAGDCTGVLMLASVAAMQGRIAMWHALGAGVTPLRLRTVAANVFTRPEIATVGVSQRAIDAGEVAARTVMLPLVTNPRAKMRGLRRGFVKLFCQPTTGVVIGGVVVAPVAGELILPIAVAVQNGLAVDDLAHTFSVYPSLSGSITEAGRQLMRPDDLD